MRVLLMYRRAFLVGSAISLSGCAGRWPSREEPVVEVYPGSVSRLHVMKGERLLRLEAGDEVVREYQIGVGFSPDGRKMVQGDGRTPEGIYRVDRRNPQSAYHLALGNTSPTADPACALFSNY